MTAILSSSVSVRTLVDGSLRLQVDIEPKDAQAAFALFGKPGSPVALARISNEAAVEHDRKAQAHPPAEPLERKPMALASRVALTCQSTSFQAFLIAERRPDWSEANSLLCHRDGEAPPNLLLAAEVVRLICGVNSRSEIISGTSAGRLWADLEADYHHWQRTGAAA